MTIIERNREFNDTFDFEIFCRAWVHTNYDDKINTIASFDNEDDATSLYYFATVIVITEYKNVEKFEFTYNRTKHTIAFSSSILQAW